VGGWLHGVFLVLFLVLVGLFVLFLPFFSFPFRLLFRVRIGRHPLFGVSEWIGGGQ
jgi:hypothetical protein